jgi:ribosome-associated translation inhibitor RaiA
VASPDLQGEITRFLRLSTKLIIMKFYVVGTRVYIPEPIAEYFTNCFSLKLPKKYYEVTSVSTITITFRDDENRVSLSVPPDQVGDVTDTLLASALDFYIALGVCTDSSTTLYRMIRKAREKVKEVLKIDSINLDPEFPICLKGGGK